MANKFMTEDHKLESLRLVEHEVNVETESPGHELSPREPPDFVNRRDVSGGQLSSTSVIIHSNDRGRLLCSARLAVMLIAVALTLATCSVWLCLDIRAMLRHEAQQVQEIKEIVGTFVNKDYFADRTMDEFSQNLVFDYDEGPAEDEEADGKADPDLLDDDADSDTPYRKSGVKSNDNLEFAMDSSDDSLDSDDDSDRVHYHLVDDGSKESPKSPSAPINSGLASKDAQCDLVPDSWRFDCHPEDGASEEKCHSRGCCWQVFPGSAKLQSVQAYPFCFYPTGYGGYAFLNQTKTATGITVFLNQTRLAYYPESVSLLRMDVTFETSYRLRIKITDALNKRYEVPMPAMPSATKTAENTLYDISFFPDWGFQVFRKSSGEILFDASVGGLLYCNQFIQLSALLPSTFLYGLGEQRASFVHNFDWQRFVLFNADHVPQENLNLYGTHPFYLMMERSSNSHGVLLFNSNAMEIVLQPTPAITYRTIGGVLDFHFFLGPSPEDVISQYTELIGRPFMPPYWSLGFHLCRFNYGTINKTERVWQRTRDAGIPFDVQWNDIDYMSKRRDFTVDEENFGDLARFVDKVHSVGMHYVPMVDCGIAVTPESEKYEPYDEGAEMDVFVKDSSGKFFVGQVWPGNSVWPDFTNPATIIYWGNQFQRFLAKVPIDGAWIDMNEPSNFLSGTKQGCPNSTWDNPPYVPGVIGNYLAHLTICMSAQQNASIHYNVHNLYGFTETIATNYALSSVRRKRPFVISRSTFPGHGYYGGHWTGDISSEWHDMRRSISDILNFNLFGIPMVGADICGFNGNTTAKLCQRWMELGAFYPFSRNHNTDDAIDQDPVALGPEVVLASLKAFYIRYQLLPYLYTLFFKAHTEGHTVARPLFFEYPNDRRTYTIDSQFLWGSALMIMPVLEEDKTSVNSYFPKGLWYIYPSFRTINSAGLNYEVDAPLDTIPLAVRGGYILPLQGVNQSTSASRLQRFELLVALNESGGAEGELFWDDGDTIGTIEKDNFNRILFQANQNSVTSSVEMFAFQSEAMSLGKVVILGVQNKPANVTVGGQDWTTFEYSDQLKVLKVKELQTPMNKHFEITWT